jgi:2'-5' RNA ligase
VAFDLPQRVKEELDRAVAPFRDRIRGARWTRPQGWHVTLKFLGGTWPRLLPEVRTVVGSSAGATPVVETRLSTVGAFPSPGRARVLWTGIEDPGGAFATLVGRLDRGLETYFVPENRAYTPHLTLARLRIPSDIVAIAPTLLALPVGSESFRVDRIVLYRSHLSPGGATYEALDSYPLG